MSTESLENPAGNRMFRCATKEERNDDSGLPTPFLYCFCLPAHWLVVGPLCLFRNWPLTSEMAIAFFFRWNCLSGASVRAINQCQLKPGTWKMSTRFNKRLDICSGLIYIWDKMMRKWFFFIDHSIKGRKKNALHLAVSTRLTTMADVGFEARQLTCWWVEGSLSRPIRVP